MKYLPLSPLALQLLLHYHAVAEPHPKQHLEVYQEVTILFLRLGVIISTDQKDFYVTTPLGNAWVKSILSTPIPRVAYLDEQNREI